MFGVRRAQPERGASAKSVGLGRVNWVRSLARANESQKVDLKYLNLKNELFG